MNARTLILPLILNATTSFSGGLHASTVRDADAQAQAAALLRGARVTPPAHLAESAASERVITDAHQQAAALLRGQAVRGAPTTEQTKRGSARRTNDAQAHAAALLRGLRAR